VDTIFGRVRVKVNQISQESKNISPEYDDCKEIAAKQGIPLKKVYEEAKTAARKLLTG